MISFDLDQTLAFNVGINTFALLVTLVTYRAYRTALPNTYDVQLMRRIETAIMVILASDNMTWLLIGHPGTVVTVLSYLFNTSYFLMQIFVAFQWIRYAYYRVYNRNMRKAQEMAFVIVPLAALALMVLVSPWTGWCFYIDAANRYHRGILSIPMSMLVLAYLLSTVVFALSQYRKAVLPDRRSELRTIAFFPWPPLVAGLVQTFTFGMSLLWPSAVLSCLLVLLNKESQAVSQDSLTGLNNRRNVQRYTMSYQQDGSGRSLAVIMLDINDFKHINDQYGHELGDQALIKVGDVMRMAFKGTDAFLARYGGDEFIVALPAADLPTAQKAAAALKQAFVEVNAAAALPFELTISAGCAQADGRHTSVTEAIRQADEQMYRDKASYHDS